MAGSSLCEQLRGEVSPERLLEQIGGIGSELAGRIDLRSQSSILSGKRCPERFPGGSAPALSRLKSLLIPIIIGHSTGRMSLRSREALTLA